MFFDSILDNGRNVLESRLVYNDGKYSIDFADLEEKLANPQTSMMILCNPHNPTGNIWDRDILDKIGKLCKKYHVLVVSDEIHCDITKPGISYIPFASVSDVCRDNCITCVAPTKTFNIAGIQTALDIADAGYEVDIDLPGFKKDEISIELENGYLTVSAAKGLDKDEEDKKGKYIRKERYAGAMQRSFYVGENLTQEDIKAKYENGILRLSVPKKEAKPVETKKTIAIEG